MYSLGCACNRAGLGDYYSYESSAPSFGYSSSYSPSFGNSSPYSTTFGINPYGSFPSGGSFGYGYGGGLPSDYSANRSWYDGILEGLGEAAADIGAELLTEIKTWLQRRIGQETWERLPETTKASMVQEAWADVRQRASMHPLLLVGGGLLLAKLLKVF